MSNQLKAVPKLAISQKIEQPEQYSPDITYSFRYKAKSHRELPHVVKFSGGRLTNIHCCSSSWKTAFYAKTVDMQPSIYTTLQSGCDYFAKQTQQHVCSNTYLTECCIIAPLEQTVHYSIRRCQANR